MLAKIIMIIYYLICLFFIIITVRNLSREASRDRVILYLLTLIPFILRLLRFK